MNETLTWLVSFLFGTFSLSQPLGFTLHFSCSKYVCGKKWQSCHLAASTYCIHIHTEHGNTWTHARFFPHLWQHTGMHTRSVSSRTPTLAAATVVPQRFLQAASDPPGQRSSSAQPLSLSRCDLRSLGDLCTCLLVLSASLWTLQSRRSSLLSHPLVYFSCLVGTNIHRVILFEWVILFEKPAVIVLIGSHRVNLIKESLYSQVYSSHENVVGIKPWCVSTLNRCLDRFLHFQ